MPTLKKLANCVNGVVAGDANCVIESVASLQDAGVGDISFLINKKYYKHLKETRADAVIVKEKDLDAVPKHAIVVQDPHVSYARIAQMLYPLVPIRAAIEKTASVHKDAHVSPDAYIGVNVSIGAGVNIAAGCYIGPGCVIDQNVSIGVESHLVCNVSVLKNCQIGQRALIHPGVVIGSDGFGLANDAGKWLKIPQIGRVCLGDDVEIGANTAIDCGAIGDTTIGDGVKLDNLVHIAHNVSIGAHTAIAACVAIAGSTRIGRHCAIAGKVGITGHIEIVDNVEIMGMSQVTQSITAPGSYASGTPVQATRDWRRNYIRFRELDELTRRIKKLEKKL